MQPLRIAALAYLVAVAAGSISAKDNFHPVSITVDQAPFDILATPITPDAPYSQREYQCNVTGDSRYPPYAFGTFPLDISVPLGKRVRVIFANGNLNGDTTTLFGEPGVIVQQGGAPIVQQAGGASPIVQKWDVPVIQQNAPPAALIAQQTPTIVQQATWPAAPSVPVGPVVDQGVNTPAPTTTPVPTQTPTPTSSPPATPLPTKLPVKNTSPPPPAATPSIPLPAASPPPTSQTPPPAVNASSAQSPPALPKISISSPATPTAVNTEATTKSAPALPILAPTGGRKLIQDTDLPVLAPTGGRKLIQDTDLPVLAPTGGRMLLQDTVPGGPNNGLVEYVALANASSVPGFYAGSTQFGVPYIEFTATEAGIGQVASFQGVLEVAQVVGGVPLYPFRPNPSLSPECQVNVNFRVAQ